MKSLVFLLRNGGAILVSAVIYWVFLWGVPWLISFDLGISFWKSVGVAHGALILAMWAMVPVMADQPKGGSKP